MTAFAGYERVGLTHISLAKRLPDDYGKSMTLILKQIVSVAALAAFAFPAHASSPQCTSAEDLVVAMTTLGGFAADITDTIKLDMVIRVTKGDGSALGERVFYRAPDGTETAMTIDAENIMTGADVLAGADARGELCREASAGAQPVIGSDFSANMKFAYTDAGGVHSASSIVEGAADGRAQLKALAPMAVRLMVPKLKYIVASKINPEDPALTVMAMRGDAPAPGRFTVQYFQGMPVFSVASLKASKADRVVITGGPYELLAMPKPGKGDLSETPQAAPNIEAAP